MTLNVEQARTLAEKVRVMEPTRKTWMKIVYRQSDPHCQRQKCRRNDGWFHSF